MELKEYQKKTLEQVKRYLSALAEFKASTPKYFTLEAWEKCGLTSYHRKTKRHWSGVAQLLS